MQDVADVNQVARVTLAENCGNYMANEAVISTLWPSLMENAYGLRWSVLTTTGADMKKLSGELVTSVGNRFKFHHIGAYAAAD